MGDEELAHSAPIAQVEGKPLLRGLLAWLWTPREEVPSPLLAAGVQLAGRHLVGIESIAPILLEENAERIERGVEALGEGFRRRVQ